MDLVSVIMPAYNAEGSIFRAITSVELQSYQNIELVIINNNSTDSTEALIKSKQKKSRLSIVHLNEPLQGVARARNTGIKHAKGRYIAFLDADDMLPPTSIKSRVDYMTLTNSSFVIGCYRRVDEKHNSLSTVIPPKIIFGWRFFVRNYVPNLTAMYDSKVLGKFYQRDLGHEDYEMWIRVFKKSGVVRRVNDEVLGYYTVASKSLSGKKYQAAIWHRNVLRKHIKNPICREGLFIWYIIASVYRVLCEKLNFGLPSRGLL